MHLLVDPVPLIRELWLQRSIGCFTAGAIYKVICFVSRAERTFSICWMLKRREHLLRLHSNTCLAPDAKFSSYSPMFTDVRGVASLQRIAPTSNFVILEPAGTLARLAHMHPKLTTKKPWEVEFADGLLHLLTPLDGVMEGPSRRGFYDSTSCLLPTSTNSRFLMGFVFGKVSGLTLFSEIC